MVAITTGAPDEVTGALRSSTIFQEIHRVGLAITLDHIAARTLGGDFDGSVGPISRALIALGEPEQLTVATLNYDGLCTLD